MWPCTRSALQRQADAGRGPRIVVGMVDSDTKFASIKKLWRFPRWHQARTGPGCRYRICQDPTQPTQYLLVLEPARATWLFEAAHAAGLAPADFGLPTTLPAFINAVKDDEAEKNPQLQKLLATIKQAQPNGYCELAAFVAGVMAADAGRGRP